jgi:hypothetical protein
VMGVHKLWTEALIAMMVVGSAFCGYIPRCTSP